uniref:Uncharacterized protein n=1 Tax=Ustilago esculenta TaxID=185366 RepID=A0A481SH37_9BASI|nr:hypothetical protein UEMT_2027 [Ustilago esculenta]
MIGYDAEHKAWKFCNLDKPASIRWSNSATFHKDKSWTSSTKTPSAEEDDDAASEAAVEEILQTMDNVVGAANTAALNLNPTLKEAMDSDDAEHWKEAIQKERDGLEAMGTWEVVSKDPAQHWKLKHIDTKYHFIHDNVQEGQVQIKY